MVSEGGLERYATGGFGYAGHLAAPNARHVSNVTVSKSRMHFFTHTLALVVTVALALDDVVFAADSDGVLVYAFELNNAVAGGSPG